MVPIAPQVARPADVLRAVAGFRPAAEAVELRALAGGARTLNDVTTSLRPHVVVNRPIHDAIQALEDGGRFRTAFDIPDGAENAWRDPAYIAERRRYEQELGMHGEGEDAGRTVYGSLHLGDGGAAGLAGAPASIYGAVAFELRPEVLARSTFTSFDSLHHVYDHSAVGGVEQLGEIIAPFVRLGDVPAKGLHQALTGALRRSNLTRWEYIEAQVRGAGVEDAARIVIEPRTRQSRADDVAQWKALRRVVELAEQRGIPVERRAR